ncbi:hypothetical protein BDB00DRAFT_812885 [Zychaea mexicana]|uniref:uncharacterized protein n=1 Tax=Zychaea mexicana TaxID=64656 RepID=UPI0022FEE51D|nr:uncharacterized protein BDB00DRAFT_812885 [Zychaea mexicana]KAI9495664.1 hypothetical protein BDB00DRAFT_812885 [Zychaea mexicana]
MTEFLLLFSKQKKKVYVCNIIYHPTLVHFYIPSSIMYYRYIYHTRLLIHTFSCLSHMALYTLLPFVLY